MPTTLHPLVKDPREEKLPVWAQGLIKDLRNRVRNERKRAEEARLATNPDESDAVLDRYDEIPIGLGKRPTVRFVLNRSAHGEVSDYIDVRMAPDGGPEIEIMGRTGIVLKPQVTNVVAVAMNPRM